MHTQPSEAIAEAIRPNLMTLRIIVLALAMGVTSFGIFSVTQNARKPQLFAKMLSLPMLIFGLVALPTGIVVPAFIFRSAMQKLASSRTSADKETDVDLARAILNQLQTTTIIGCAIWEGGAFANINQYFMDGELLHLIVAGVLLLAILVRFPWPGRCEQIIADQLLRMNEEQSLRRTP